MCSYLSEASQDHQLPTLSAGRLSEEGPTVAAREYLSATMRHWRRRFIPANPLPPFYAMPVMRSIRRSATCGKRRWATLPTLP